MIRDEGMLEQLLSTIRDFVKNELIPRENEVVRKTKFRMTLCSKCVSLVCSVLQFPKNMVA